MSTSTPTSTHWGNYLVEEEAGRVLAVHPYAVDLSPSPMAASLMYSQDPLARIATPMVRKSFLHRRASCNGDGRGREPFVSVSWQQALDIAAEEIDRVRSQHSNEAIFGGSYGWASAGRFHHAQSQLHRFLGCAGGYTDSVNSYSVAAGEVFSQRVLGIDFFDLMMEAPTVPDMLRETRLVVCFGGIAMKNTQVMAGGLGAHTAETQLRSMAEKRIGFVNVSPLRDDIAPYLNASWWPCRPGSDVAIMLALAHEIVIHGLHDTDFLQRYCAGFDRFLPYLLGESDGQPKSAQWAAAISDIPADQIKALAHRMATQRTVISVSWSLQRSEHGEQPYWMATVLGALLGYIGLPGGGVAFGLGSVHNVGFLGRRKPHFRFASLPRAVNPVTTAIPVARIADMLLNPGMRIPYNGTTIRYPDVRLIYWAGGNPYHHHQDLNKLRRAWARPEVVIVNEPFWTATARRADIVFPCTTVLERNDFGAVSDEVYLTPMRRVLAPFAESRSDFDIFSELAGRLGCHEAFTENRNEMQWVRHLYDQTRGNAANANVSLPAFDEFWSGEQISIADQLPESRFTLERFRDDAGTHPLCTPSAKIEIYSEAIASFGYTNCPGHPVWQEPKEWLGSAQTARFPVHLISNQPKTKLHSQYDYAPPSIDTRVREREVVRMNPDDARRRGLVPDDIVRIYNDRGSCLAAVGVTDALRPGVAELPTGAWYDPVALGPDQGLDVHGNPNVLTQDVGTSSLAQGPVAHSCLVEIERFEGPLPALKVTRPPDIE